MSRLTLILTIFWLCYIDVIDGNYTRPTAFKFESRNGKCFVNRYKLILGYTETELEENHHPIDAYPMDCPSEYDVIGMNIYKREDDIYNLFLCFLIHKKKTIQCYYLNDDGKIISYKTFDEIEYEGDPIRLFIGKNSTNGDSFIIHTHAIKIYFHSMEAKGDLQSYNSIKGKWKSISKEHNVNDFGEYRYFQYFKNETNIIYVEDYNDEKTRFLSRIILKYEYNYVADLTHLDQVKFLPSANKTFVGFKFFNHTKKFCVFQKYEKQYYGMEDNKFNVTNVKYQIGCFNGHIIHGSNMIKKDNKYHLYACFYFKSTQLICQYLDENNKFITDFNNTVSEFQKINDPFQLKIGLNSDSKVFILTDRNGTGVVYSKDNENVDGIHQNSVYDPVTNKWLKFKWSESLISVFDNYASVQSYSKYSNSFLITMYEPESDIIYYKSDKETTPFDFVCVIKENSKSRFVLPNIQLLSLQ